jgi:dipeptidase E
VAQLFSYDAIHLTGGNTYHFLFWLRARGLVKPLQDYVAQGAILMTPEISSASLCGDAPLAGEEMTDLSALGLVDFAFLPHIQQIEGAAALLKNYAQQHARVIYGCQDGDGIVVNGGQVELVGAVQKG